MAKTAKKSSKKADKTNSKTAKKGSESKDKGWRERVKNEKEERNGYLGKRDYDNSEAYNNRVKTANEYHKAKCNDINASEQDIKAKYQRNIEHKQSRVDQHNDRNKSELERKLARDENACIQVSGRNKKNIFESNLENLTSYIPDDFSDAQVKEILAATDRYTRKPTLSDRLANLLKTPGYMVENVLYFLFGTSKVNELNDKALESDYTREDTVTVFLHGYYQTAAASFGKMQKIFDKFGKKSIALQYDYSASIEDCVEEVASQLRYIRKKVGPARLVLIGHSTGADTANSLMQKYSHLVDECIPIAGAYDKIASDKLKWKDIFTEGKGLDVNSSLSLWPLRYILPKKDSDVTEAMRERQAVGPYARLGNPKTRINMFGRFDSLVPINGALSHRINVKDVGVNKGHFGEIISYDSALALLKQTNNDLPRLDNGRRPIQTRNKYVDTFRDSSYEGFFEQNRDVNHDRMLTMSVNSLRMRHS